MTFEFKFFEGQLRRQLPELAAAYSNAKLSESGDETGALFAEDAQLHNLSVPRPPGPRSHTISRNDRALLIGITTSAAALGLIAGLFSAVIANTEKAQIANTSTRGLSSSIDVASTQEIDFDSPTTTPPATATTAIISTATSEIAIDEVAIDETLINEPAISSIGTNGEQTVIYVVDSTTTSTAVPATTKLTEPTTPFRTPATFTTSKETTSTRPSGRGCVGNLVWHDLDGDGTQDPDESGIVGANVTLIDDANIRVDEKVLSNGYFSLCGPVGKYLLAVEIPAGFMVSPASQGNNIHNDSDADPNGMIAVTVDHGKKRTKYDIGLTKTKVPPKDSDSTPTH